MFDEFQYVVKFPNGYYYNGIMSYPKETDDLKYANKYSFDWQPMRDKYLQMYCNEKDFSYELIKIKTVYEIIE
jgi:hypothetical protein